MLPVHALTPVREALLRKAGVPIEWSFETEQFRDSILFEMHFVDNDWEWVDKIRNAFNEIFSKSSVKDRFDYQGEKQYTNFGYMIKINLKAYPRINEKVEDLVTVLKLEGLI